MPVDVIFDTKQLSRLSRQLKEVDPVMRKALPARLRAAAQPAVTEAQAHLPSQRITVKASYTLALRGANLALRASSKADPPLPGLLEYGSQGSGGRYIRHPVFGHDRWVNQPTKPFLRAAVEKHADEMIHNLEGIVDDIAAVVGAV